MDSLGMKLKLARTRAKLNQTEATEKLKKYDVDITQSYLSKIENDINEPDIKQLKAFANIYDINILTLIFTDDEIEQLTNK